MGANDAADRARIRQEEASSQLAQVAPQKEAAKQAVDNIDRRKIDEMKTLNQRTNRVLSSISVPHYMLGGAVKSPPPQSRG